MLHSVTFVHQNYIDCAWSKTFLCEENKHSDSAYVLRRCSIQILIRRVKVYKVYNPSLHPEKYRTVSKELYMTRNPVPRLR